MAICGWCIHCIWELQWYDVNTIRWSNDHMLMWLQRLKQISQCLMYQLCWTSTQIWESWIRSLHLVLPRALPISMRCDVYPLIHVYSRLKLLDAKFQMYQLLSEDKEFMEQKVSTMGLVYLLTIISRYRDVISIMCVRLIHIFIIHRQWIKNIC